MPEIRSSCPHCGQHVAADSGYAGSEMACPSCARTFVLEPLQEIEPPLAPPLAAAAGQCPSCGAALARGKVICNRCDFNLATGKHMTKVRRSAQSDAEPGELRWYTTPYPYIGAALLVLAIFDFLGRNNSTLKFSSVVFTLAYLVAVSLLVLRSAKDDGLVHALLIVLFPPYALFYVCAVNKDKSLIVLWLSGWVAIFALCLINPHWN